MTNRLLTLAAAATCAISIAPFDGSASAMPIAHDLGLSNAGRPNIESVRWGGGGWHGGWHGGWGFGAGLLGGAIIGGLLASPYYYAPGPYYGPYYGPGYYPARGYNYWSSRCVANWGYDNPNYYGCMRYYGF